MLKNTVVSERPQMTIKYGACALHGECWCSYKIVILLKVAKHGEQGTKFKLTLTYCHLFRCTLLHLVTQPATLQELQPVLSFDGT
jgi:hypothetical protein